MKAKIEIQMDNAAFDGAPGQELSRILTGLAGSVQWLDVTGPEEIPLRDSNGNRVGQLKITR